MVELFNKISHSKYFETKMRNKVPTKSGKIDRSRNQFVNSLNERNFCGCSPQFGRVFPFQDWERKELLYCDHTCQARVTTIDIPLILTCRTDKFCIHVFSSERFFKFQEVQHYSRGHWTILISAFFFFLVFLFQQKLPGEICVTQTGILDILVLFNQDTNILYTITIF